MISDANDPSDKLSKRSILFLTFISGSAIFYGYQAQLTSTLAVVPIEKPPFETPEEILSTNYKVLTGSKSGFTAAQLLHAPKNSIFEKIFQDHMDNESFTGYGKGYKKVAYSDTKLTFFGENDQVKERCYLKAVWKSPQRYFASFALKKRSPYLAFFNQAILDLREKGVFHHLNEKWRQIIKVRCKAKDENLERISFEKIILLLVTLLVGIGMALIIVSIEFLFKK